MVVVTGATGLVGSFLIQKLADANEQVIAFHRKKPNTNQLHSASIKWMECDILDIDKLTECIPESATVIHCAAHVSFDPRKRDELFKTNVEGTANVVNVCSLKHARLIHVSSVAALGRQKGLYEVDETAQWVDSPLNSSYGESKHQAELEVYRGIEEGLSATIVCPSFILAPSDWDQSSSQIFKYIWQERLFYSGGFANYVDVRDVVEILFRLYLQADVHQGVRMIASGGSISYRELFSKIAERFEKRAPRIKINDSLLHTIARLEEIRCFLTRSTPLITRESVKSAGEKFIYSNKKSLNVLGMKYHSLEETLEFCCEHYLRTYSTKK
ncbi:MAG: NAD-dependent epimerase/dehydratase family protein [Cyclobacteriaceae bacterium]|jgi:dihydroflavonol-4-reductase|nr:NAD-dependent epimerase/dehydratase family protein [Flammeovirgaceae bacterium]